MVVIKTTVYGDVLFVINFSMDILSMYISGKILHLDMKKRELIFSCIIGGIYGVLSLLIKNAFLSVIMNISVYLLMCFIAFPKVRLSQYIKLCFLFWSVSLLMGGAVTWCYSFIDRFASGAVSSQSPARKMPLYLFLLTVLFCAVSAFITGKIFSKNKDIKDAVVYVLFDGRCVEAHVLVDSGNLLTDPLSGLPVILVTDEKFKAVTGESSDTLLQNGKLISKIRFIPASSAGGDTMLYGVVSDVVLKKAKGKEVPYKAVIAVCKNSGFADFDGVFPLCLYE